MLGQPNDLTQPLDAAIAAAAALLPEQGPIGVFIHHNTLHAFQHLPFDTAVLQAGEVFGARPYLSEAEYQAHWRAGRITADDIAAVLAEMPDVRLWAPRPGLPELTHRELLRRLLTPGLRPIALDNLNWCLQEADWLSHWRRDVEPGPFLGEQPLVMFEHIAARCTRPPTPAQAVAARPRDAWLAATGEDLDTVIHPVLIRFVAAFLDQGVGHWPMPGRDAGLWPAALNLLRQRPAAWSYRLEPVLVWLDACAAQQFDSRQAVLAALATLQVSPQQLPGFIQAELLALPGWTGLIAHLEHHPELAPHVSLPARLMDFLALRLALTVGAWHALGPHLCHWSQLAPAAPERPEDANQRLWAAQLFDLAQLCGLSTAALSGLSEAEFTAFEAALRVHDDLTRRRCWHLAYERHHETAVLAALALHLKESSGAQAIAAPTAQVVCCIDEREESFRRHLEEVAPRCDTFGAAGFFGAAIHYQGIDDAHAVDLCPVVLTPQHAIREVPSAAAGPQLERRRMLRQWWGRLVQPSLLGAGTLVRGSLAALVLGVLQAVPVTARILRPRAYARLLQSLRAVLLPQPETELTHRAMDDAASDAGGRQVGFSSDEQADRVAQVLLPAGLAHPRAPLVVILGHGSTSRNNPHESAHDCGACGGRRGGPNARLFALMANDPEVRAKLLARGCEIPEGTWFIGGYHDTSSDEVELFDRAQVPASHHAVLAEVTAWLDAARARNAHERSRRLEAAPLGLSIEAALQHVEARAEHLAEPRPEYGHCTNAVCVVAPRELTRGLFLDRRAFLFSYAPKADAGGGLLGRVLGAAVPVCGGINLEYFFSFVDQERYGCGTKLPHNITGLVGIMDGFQSDLRTGLPLQMVELHEPVRILFVVASNEAQLLASVNANPVTAEFLHNHWIRMACVDPDTGAISVYRDHGFVPFVCPPDARLPEAPSSIDWYAGSRAYLPIARIRGDRAA